VFQFLRLIGGDAVVWVAKLIPLPVWTAKGLFSASSPTALESEGQQDLVLQMLPNLQAGLVRGQSDIVQPR